MPPAHARDAHDALSEKERAMLQSIFSRQEERVIQNDFTIRHKNAWFQLKEVQPCLVRPKATVIVEEWTDGALHARLGKHELSFVALPRRPQPRWERSPVALTTHAPHRERKVPAPDTDDVVEKDSRAGMKKWKRSNNLFFPPRRNTKDKNT